MTTIPTYVINTKDVFGSDLILTDPELYACRNTELHDLFDSDTIPLKQVSLKTPTKEKQLYDIFNAPHNRFVLHTFLVTSANRLRWEKNRCDQHVIKRGGQGNSLDLKDSYKIYLIQPWTKDACLKLLMIHHLKHHVHARLGKADYGVGVFAIRDIPKGMPIFDTLLTKCATYSPVSISGDNVININARTDNSPIKSLLADFFLMSGEKINYPVPVYGPNSIDTSFYLNHSSTPNLEITYPDDCDMSVYVAKENIKAGNELTIDYTTFGFTKEEIKKRMPFLSDFTAFNSVNEVGSKRPKGSGGK